MPARSALWASLVLWSSACEAPRAYDGPTPDDTGHSGDGVTMEEHALAVVIGAGPGGMAAAMDLPGAILLEATDRVGGRAPGSPGIMMFVGTQEQLDRGAIDSADQAVEDWPVLTGAEATPSTIEFLEECASVRDRLVDLGLKFDLLSRDPILKRERMHGTAVALADVLLDGLPHDVDLRYETPATGLLIEDGAVTGVQVDGRVITTDVVVIASGGFANRVDLVERYSHWDAGTWGVGSDPGAMGDAADWADAWSLGMAHADAIGAAADAIGVPGEDGQATRRTGAGPPMWIWVDASGRRFIDETQYWSVTLAGQAEAHAPVWALTTETELEAIVDPNQWKRVLAGCTCADDWAGLADAIGIDPDGVLQTVEDVGHYSPSHPDPYGRAALYFPNLDGHPCAFPPGLLASKNFGGLDVDEEGRVRDTGGRVVTGLWAVGEAAGMGVPGMGGRWGFDGSLSAVVWSGWHAAAAINAEQEGR
jgi:fumarate reductase flavoprotein subunit